MQRAPSNQAEVESTSSPAGEGWPAPADIESRLAALAARSRRLSLFRLIAFAGFVAGFVSAFEHPLGWLAATAGLAWFLTCLYRHGSVLDDRKQNDERLRLVRERDARRSSRRGSRRAPMIPERPLPLEEGRRVFLEEPESWELGDGVLDDLEVLTGPRNLFAFLDVSSSPFGAARLRYLLTHALKSPDEIIARQRAVGALGRSPRLQERLLEILISLRERDLGGLPREMSEPMVFSGRRGLFWVVSLLGTLAPLLLVLSAWEYALAGLALVLIVVNASIVGTNVRSSNPARDRLIRLGPLLDTLLRLDVALQSSELDEGPWSRIRECLEELEPSARRLSRQSALLHFHDSGVLFEIVNVLVLWELRILPRAETILRQHRDEIRKAIGTLGEIEALLSLSLPLVEQAGFSVPEPLQAERPVVVAEGLGHPLIEDSRLVRNDFSLGEPTRLAIITGSNMAGKSTFLKAVGINLILAGAGGPVCARRFRWTPLAIYSDVNTRDSLDDGKSYFQVEVERVREILATAREDIRMLGIFDELFRGTNSTERRAISRAILRYLEASGVLVLVATHDEALTETAEFEDETRRSAANFHFQERIEGHTMTFEYRLREGPASTRNAIRVLEVSGYPEEVTRDAHRDVGAR